MKKIKFNVLLCSLAIAGLTFTSCSDDDSNGTSDDTRIEGTYNLEEVNTAASTDFDEDGDAHINQMEESSCYNSGKIILNSDNTFEYTVVGILIDNGEAGCAESYTVNGVYTAEPASNPSNALITLTYSRNGETITRQFTKIGDELSWNDDTILSAYPDRDSEGTAIMTPGSVEYVYER
ncbi:hypothetical protein [Flavobacterium sp. NRK1]|uniref:hypothetical protein n=1 Tax=Flavobacterium sp. NRK1 TaxID=2954929 RepID=UPI002092E0B5|nr:hypothetical protein [Flavobacterium sp. NRK1]MCO6148877.1 hypothetical protein [Flavobacterium sp. NRK1]